MIFERLAFTSQDVKLGGLFVGPDSGVTRGGVLCITGGGVADCEVPYLEWQQYMAEEAQLATLSFNARGVGDSGGTFRTDDARYDPDRSPANSQASRTADTEAAFSLLTSILDLDRAKAKTGVIGGSMGGDIALHSRLETAALILRAPSAYPDEVHDMLYGPEWGPAIRELGGDDAALRSANFARIKKLQIPTMLLYTMGDIVIPKVIQNKYSNSVETLGGKVIIVGDNSVPHTYINDSTKPEKDTEKSREARDKTFRVSTEFFLENIH